MKYKWIVELMITITVVNGKFTIELKPRFLLKIIKFKKKNTKPFSKCTKRKTNEYYTIRQMSQNSSYVAIALAFDSHSNNTWSTMNITYFVIWHRSNCFIFNFYFRFYFAVATSFCTRCYNCTYSTVLFNRCSYSLFISNFNKTTMKQWCRGV